MRSRASRAAGRRGIALTILLLLSASSIAAAGTSLPGRAGSPITQPPERLSETGLYAEPARKTIRPENLPFEPQYPLWSDGAAKRRWIHLPPGSYVDASEPDQWKFPVGTKLWKEFRFGRAVETRYMELAPDNEWIYATYAWSEDGSDALLVPAQGLRGAAEIRPGIRHDIPGHYDCLACHEGQPSRVLGFSALQLSSDRDPLAPHAVEPAPDAIDLDGLIERGLVKNLPERFTRLAPRIEAPTARARAALGYLHGNCGGCHNRSGPLAEMEFSLAVELADSSGAVSHALSTAVGRASRFRPPGKAPDSTLPRISPGDVSRSVLVDRIRSRQSSVQMPPLGTRIPDEEAIDLITAWIREDLPARGIAHLRHPAQSMEEKP